MTKLLDMEKRKQNFRKLWLIFTILGLILIGAGISFITDAAFYKQSGAEPISWILYGTFALVVFNSGICFVGQGIIYRIKLHLAESDL